MREKRIYILMVLTAVFWSGAFITGKMAIVQFPPLALTFLRFLFAFPLILTVLLLRQPGNWLPDKKEWPQIILLGFIGIFLYHALFFSCLKYTTAINSSLIASTNPMFTVLLAFLLFGEKISPLRAVGVALSFIGVFLTVTNGDLRVISGMQFNYGDILMFIAVICWVLYGLLSRRVMERHNISPLKLTTWTFFVCVIITFPLFLWEQPGTFLAGATSGGWLSILYMAVFSSVLGYLFNNMAIAEIGAAKASIFVNLVPVFTIILSVAVLGESFGWFKLMSATIIIAGVYLTSRPVRQEEAKLKFAPASLSMDKNVLTAAEKFALSLAAEPTAAKR